MRVRADGCFSALRRELHSDKELAKRRRAGRAAAAASAQWERTPTPLPPWAHGGYFAPARRYGARAALARTQRGGFRSTLHDDRRSVEGEWDMVASVEYHVSYARTSVFSPF